MKKNIAALVTGVLLVVWGWRIIMYGKIFGPMGLTIQNVERLSTPLGIIIIIFGLYIIHYSLKEKNN